MSNSVVYNLSLSDSKILCRTIDKCRIKTNLNKESIIDEILYAVSADDGNVQLYAIEWLYIIDALKDKLKGKRIQDREALDDLLHDLLKLKLNLAGE